VFTSLPLHAAGIYDGRLDHRDCCADYVVSSYTPTLTSLLRLRKTAVPLARDALNFMLVAEARAYDPRLQVIPGVEDEVNCIAAVADLYEVHISSCQVGSTTTVDTSAAMKVGNLVHLACHGVQDIGDGTQSGFCLGDGRLTIAQLMELHLKDAFLAFLSACETATGSKEHPDQALHVAAAMLFGGFKNVIASMWCVSLLINHEWNVTEEY
jgi:CHAT domain-containing protein